MKPIHYLRCFAGITAREWRRFLNQRGRFFSALVRPLVWLGIFATGFRFVLGVSIIPPYETYIPYDVYIAPGLIAMILLFNGMLISSGIRQLENFAGVMNFVIFPMFFASSALYPLWRVQEGSPLLYYVCQANPFTHAVELTRFALYGQVNWVSLAVVAGCTLVFAVGAILAYDPSRGMSGRRGPAGGD